MIRLVVVSLLVIACGPDTDSKPSHVAPAPDSAGWRSVALDRLAFRYPVSHVRNVIDRRSSDCTLPAAPYGEGPDSTVDGSLIISSGPTDFDSIASLFGFVHPAEMSMPTCSSNDCAGARDWQMKQGDQWFGDDFANLIHQGSWRGLVGTMTMLGYFDDMPDSLRSPKNNADATSPKESVYQGRFFVVAPLSSECSAVISWRGQPVTDYHGGAAAAVWDSSLIRHMLNTATLGQQTVR